MTRKEKIQNYAYSNCITDGIDDTSYSLIVDAISWADETMIDNVCEWLDKVDTDGYMDSGIFQMSVLIADLKEELKGE